MALGDVALNGHGEGLLFAEEAEGLLLGAALGGGLGGSFLLNLYVVLGFAHVLHVKDGAVRDIYVVGSFLYGDVVLPLVHGADGAVDGNPRRGRSAHEAEGEGGIEAAPGHETGKSAVSTAVFHYSNHLF